MNNSEKNGDSNKNTKTSYRLALASIVLALIAFFGVLPLVFIPINLYCLIYDCPGLDYQLAVMDSLCTGSILFIISAIIVGLISFFISKGDDKSKKLSKIGMGLGFLALLLFFVTAIYFVGASI